MSNQKDEVLVLSRILDKSSNNQLVGFVLLDMSTGMIYRLKTDKIPSVLGSNYCSNARWDDTYKTLVGTANSLTEYPSIGTDGSVIDKNGMTASHRILDSDTGEEIGAVVFDAFGKQFNLTCKKLLKMSKEKGIRGTNFVIASDGKIVSRVKDYEFRTITKKTVGKRQSYRSTDGEKSPVTDTGDCSVPFINVSGFDDIKDNSFASSAQDNMLMALSNLRKVSPYYHSVLSSVKKTPVHGLGTLCVDEKDLYYDIEFVSQLTVEELTFILIHELMHILMRHSLRGRHKNHDIWNIAADLYINEIICSEAGIDSLDRIVEVDGGLNQRGRLKAQKDGVYAFKYGISLDLARETPETIYVQMCKENQDLPSNYSNSNSNSGNQGQQGGSGQQQDVREAIKQVIKTCNEVRETAKRANEEARQNGDSQSMKDALDANNEAKGLSSECRKESDCNTLGQDIKQAGQNIEQSGSQMGQNGNSRGDKLEELGKKLQQLGDSIQNASSGQGGSGNQGNQSQGQQGGQSSQGHQGGQSGQGQGNQGQNGDFEDLNGSKPEQGNGDLNDGNEGQSSENGVDQTGVPKGHKRIKVTFKGQEIDAVIQQDLTSSIQGSNSDATKKAVDASKNALQRAKTKVKMDEEKTGSKFASNLGSGEMERQIDFGLSADVTWQKLLQNVTPRKHKKQFTMTSPSRSYMNRGITMATRQPIGRPNEYTGIKFAIDVSGSVGQEELSAYLADVTSIFDRFKVDGELLYWSTMVGDAGKFSDKKDALKIKPVSSGGTDVRCVFDYLIGKTKVNEKFEETKPRDIEAVFILTDGYFSNNYDDYRDAFGGKVVWVIDGDPSRFRPPFGKVVGLHKETY